MNRLVIPIALTAALAFSTVLGGVARAQDPGDSYGYGYNDRQAPAGSYRQSCTSVRIRGSRLSAVCSAANGARVRTSLDVDACTGVDIGNINGQLQCVRPGFFGDTGRTGRNGRGNRYHTGYLPAGSYQQSCSNARMSGNMLRADCQSTRGGTATSYLDTTQCRQGEDIGNVDGQLRCVYRP